MATESSWLWALFACFARMSKLIVRWIFGTHEIERILGRKYQYEMPYLLEQYIEKSRKLKSINAALKSPSLDTHTMYEKIISLKALNTETTLHQQYIAPNLIKSLKMIKKYNVVVRDLEEAVIPFDPNDSNHRQLLFSFWNAMDPLTVYSNLSNPVQQIEFEHTTDDYCPPLESIAWEFVGFQGEKPWTDFRGVGLFGLEQLNYFGSSMPTDSQEILSYCMQSGQLKCYSFAITGINITYDVMTWFRQRKASLFYHKWLSHRDELDAVHGLYNLAYCKFYKLWKSNPPQTVMGYGDVHKKFIRMMEAGLKKGDVRVTEQG